MTKPTRVNLNEYLDFLEKELSYIIKDIENHQKDIDKCSGYVRMKLQNKQKQLQKDFKFASRVRDKFIDIHKDEL